MIYVSLMHWADSRMNSVCMCVSRLVIRKSSALRSFVSYISAAVSLSLTLVAPPQSRQFTVLSVQTCLSKSSVRMISIAAAFAPGAQHERERNIRHAC